MLGCHELIVEEVAFNLKFLVEQLQLDERPSAYLEGGCGGRPQSKKFLLRLSIA